MRAMRAARNGGLVASRNQPPAIECDANLSPPSDGLLPHAMVHPVKSGTFPFPALPELYVAPVRALLASGRIPGSLAQPRVFATRAPTAIPGQPEYLLGVS